MNIFIWEKYSWHIFLKKLKFLEFLKSKYTFIFAFTHIQFESVSKFRISVILKIFQEFSFFFLKIFQNHRFFFTSSFFFFYIYSKNIHTYIRIIIYLACVYRNLFQRPFHHPFSKGSNSLKDIFKETKKKNNTFYFRNLKRVKKQNEKERKKKKKKLYSLFQQKSRSVSFFSHLQNPRCVSYYSTID